MSSIRAAARAALERKRREAEAMAGERRVERPDLNDEAGENARPGTAAVKPKAVAKKSRWGSSDDESEEEDDNHACGRREEVMNAGGPSTGGQGYTEKMLAEANLFAAAQRDMQDVVESGKQRSQGVDPKQFFAPSPSSEDGHTDASPEAGPARPPEGLTAALAELESCDEEEPIAGPARPPPVESSVNNTELEDAPTGPARPDPEISRLRDQEGKQPVQSLNVVDAELQVTRSMSMSMLPLKKKALDMLQRCRSVDEFERLNKIDEGTHWIVFKARDKRTGEVAALKRVIMDEADDGFPLTALREVNILLSLDHPSIVNVNEVVVGSKLNFVFMVMEYVENDLKGLMDQMAESSVPRFTVPEVKAFMLQLLSGMSYLHENWIMHRDLKMSNILVTNSGDLKICDFGLARPFGGVGRYTQLVVTLWYRPPELLLGATTYGPAIDVWSLGCIFGELLSGAPLFNGRAEIDQLQKIFKLLGTPNDKIWPEFSSLPSVQKVTFTEQPYNKLRQKFPRDSTGLSDNGFELLNRMLTYDPSKRFTCSEALNHPFFEEYPPPQRPVFVEEA